MDVPLSLVTRDHLLESTCHLINGREAGWSACFASLNRKCAAQCDIDLKEALITYSKSLICDKKFH